MDRLRGNQHCDLIALLVPMSSGPNLTLGVSLWTQCLELWLPSPERLEGAGSCSLCSRIEGRLSLAQVSGCKVRSGQTQKGDARLPMIQADTFKMGQGISTVKARVLTGS